MEGLVLYTTFTFIVLSLPTYTYVLVLSLLFSLFVYKRPRTTYLQIFPPFLLLTVVVEVYSSYLWSTGKNNITIYNFFSAFEFGFYIFLISIIIKSHRAKRIAYATILIYTIAAFVNIGFIQGLSTFHTTTYALGCLLVVAFCIYYFYELFRFPDSGKLAYNPAFWICTGLLFFYCCGFPLYGLMNLWSSSWTLMVNSFNMITTVLNIFLYSLFTIAFLCVRIRNYILSQ